MLKLEVVQCGLIDGQTDMIKLEVVQCGLLDGHTDMMKVEVVQCGLLDGQTDIMKVEVAFRSSRNAPKIKSLLIKSLTVSPVISN